MVRRIACGFGHGNIVQESATTGDGYGKGERPKIVIFKNGEGRIVGSALGNKFGPKKEGE